MVQVVLKDVGRRAIRLQEAASGHSLLSLFAHVRFTTKWTATVQLLRSEA